MNVLECIKSRRSIRKFLPVPVEFDKIANVLEAGRHAPSAGNVQNWRFVLITDDDMKKKIAAACMQQLWMEQAPVILVVCAQPGKGERLYGARGKEMYTVQNCAAAVENMLLVAHEEGLGACWVGAFEEGMLRSAVGISGSASPQAVLCFGYADEKPSVPPRYELENIIFVERYGNKINDMDAYLEDYSVHVQKAVSKLKTFVGTLVRQKKK